MKNCLARSKDNVNRESSHKVYKWIVSFQWALCTKQTLSSSSRSKLYSKVTEIVPNFLVLSDSDKFKYILSSNDYDIMKICVIDISEISYFRAMQSNLNIWITFILVYLYCICYKLVVVTFCLLGPHATFCF